MEQKTDELELLNLITRPVFCVKNRCITKVNEAAARLFLQEGMDATQLFEAGLEDYLQFDNGMLYVTLSICAQPWGASITRIGEQDIFSMDQQFGSNELRVLALAARELRAPLSNVMLAAQQLEKKDEAAAAVSRMNRGINQLLRIIGNMSDAAAATPSSKKRLCNADALFGENLEKASALTGNNAAIHYHGLAEEVLIQADQQQLERAALNMLSNAIKFSEGGQISAELQKCGKMLRFSVTDHGRGMNESIEATLFQRYLRDPVIEDSRHGIGLGMLIIRNAAAAHGGAVLIDHPDGCGTRISITLSCEKPSAVMLRSPAIFADYAGELDHALLELSECLPVDLF